jgi:acetyltransferase-like isoleucine patch superfamily enzyme
MLLLSLKRLVRSIRAGVRVRIYRLRGLQIGLNSTIDWPYYIEASKFLFIGDRTSIHSNAYITPITNYADVRYSPEIRIGNDVYIGRHVFLVALNSLVIEDGCVLSEHVYISDNAHGYDPEGGPILQQPLMSKGPVHIGRSCFLGYRSVVMPGVQLGEHCIVGANSVVTRSFPPYSMLAGCPAKRIKVYSKETREWISASS